MSHAKQMLVDLVNRDNNLKLRADQVIFKDVANNWDPLIKRNTYALMEAVPGKGCKNSTPLYYHRIDLSVLFLNVNANVPLPQPLPDTMTTHDLLPLINAKYGTNFEPEDIISTDLDLDNLPGTAQIRAMDGNVAYTSAFTVTFGQEDLVLATIVLNTTLSGFNLPNDDPTKGQAFHYSYNFDGSLDPDGYWTAVTTGPTAATIVAPFNRIKGVEHAWVHQAGATKYNLGGAEIVYNGANDAAKLLADWKIVSNPLYRQVVVIKLSATDCTDFGGYLTVYHGGRV